MPKKTIADYKKENEGLKELLEAEEKGVIYKKRERIDRRRRILKKERERE